MTYTHPHTRTLVSAFITVTLMAVLSFMLSRVEGDQHVSAVPTSSPCGDTCHGSAPVRKTPEERLAQRLKERLERSGIVAHEQQLGESLAERKEFLSRSVTVTVQDTGSGSHRDEWTLNLADHPQLIVLEDSWIGGPRFVIDETALAALLPTLDIENMHKAVSAHIPAIASDGFVLRAQTTQNASDGFAYDFADLAERLSSALEDGVAAIDLDLPYEKASVTIAVGSGSQTLSLLATGISDYSNSPEARISNVHKAIEERVNNVVVAPGEKFSFVATLGGPVTLDKGWKEALGLFGGGTALTPGGGICQAATTVFRAALLAGLPITEKRNHSVFVDHYEPYGVGLDATIFPGVHDLSFLNDTSSYIVLQAHIVGDDVFVNVFGIPDGRTVALDGPYFYTTKPRSPELRPLGKDQIGWVRQVTYADGTVKTMPSIATYYTGFMRSVREKYAGTPGISLLYTGGAPLQASL